MIKVGFLVRMVVFCVAAIAYGLSAVMPSGSQHRVLIRADDALIDDDDICTPAEMAHSRVRP